MFFHAADFIENVLLFRVCWFRGRLGGGKTSGCVALAYELMRMRVVDGCVSNFPTVLPPYLRRDDGTLFDRVVIFDEAWQMLDSRRSLVNANEYGAFARKMNAYWLFPSVHPVDKRVRSVTVWRSATLFNDTVWVYRWMLDLDYTDDDGGWFLIIHPGEYFDMFDTRFVPLDDGGVLQRYQRTLFEMTGQVVRSDEAAQVFLEQLQEIGGIDAFEHADAAG